MTGPAWLSVKEACVLLGVSRISLWRWVRDGKLAQYRLPSGAPRFWREDLLEAQDRALTADDPRTRPYDSTLG